MDVRYAEDRIVAMIFAERERQVEMYGPPIPTEPPVTPLWITRIVKQLGEASEATEYLRTFPSEAVPQEYVVKQYLPELTEIAALAVAAIQRTLCVMDSQEADEHGLVSGLTIPDTGLWLP